MKWRFVDTGERDGAFNMAVDEVLLSRCASGSSAPVLRVYRWKPWALSLGRMQDAARCLDLPRCRVDGVPIVRRPTGGRAVFHAEELTYSFAARLSDLPVSPTVGETYAFVAVVLVDALRSLGVAAEVRSPDRRDERTAARTGPRSAARRAPCFASVSQYEICAGGRKLVGSAQRRWPEAVLQHGSILLGPAHRAITSYLRERPRPGEMPLEAATTSVREVLGRNPRAAELAASLRRAAERVWRVEMEESRLSAAELHAAEQFVQSRYANDDWNLGRGEWAATASGQTPGDRA